jgi:hypothetical protein
LARDLNLRADIVVADAQPRGTATDPVPTPYGPKSLFFVQRIFPRRNGPEKLRGRLERRGVPIIFTHESVL